MRMSTLLLWLLLLTMFGSAFVGNVLLPPRVLSHWNAGGIANGTMPRTIGVLLLPLLALALTGLFLLLRRIDPRKENLDETYDAFLVAFLSFLLLFQLIILLVNLGVIANPIFFFTLAFCVFFIIVGLLLRRIRPNYTFGIRTPWTLANDEVWQLTHRGGGVLFMVAGALGLIGLFASRYAFWIVIILILLAVLATTVYSYLMYRKVAAPSAGKPKGFLRKSRAPSRRMPGKRRA